MSSSNELPTQPPIQRHILWFVVAIFVLALLAYFANFHGPISDDQGKWGEFGDFIGGIFNPIVGLGTIWLLVVSLNQNQLALRQSQKELELTRLAVEDAREMQRKTEETLKQQVSIAEHGNDMSTAMAIWFNLYNISAEIMKQQMDLARDEHPDIKVVEALNEQYQMTCKMVMDFNHILNMEKRRLLNKYPAPESKGDK